MNTNFKFSAHIINKRWEKEIEIQPNESKYTQLYKAIKCCIQEIDLPNKWILPSTRYLSNYLKLSRTTVIKSYELLLLENLIEAKPGSGYRVCYIKDFSIIEKQKKGVFDSNDYPKLSKKGVSFLENYGLINREKNDFIAFRPGLPPLDAFPVNQWKNLLNNYWRYIKSSHLSYAQATGLDSLKESIKNFLNVSRSIKCKKNQIIVLSGSLQSLYVISSILINERDPVVLENPSFPNVHSIFKSLKANIVPAELDKSGIDITTIKKNIKPKLIHVTPSNQYPTGIKMSIERRKKIISWASSHQSIIIENDYENEISNVIEKTPTIFSLDTEGRTVYMGTFNRLLHPSIRLGFMVVPEYLIQPVNALQEHSHRFVAPSIQVVMNQFIERNYLYKHLNNIINISQKRHKLFVEAFSNCTTISLLHQEYLSLHIVGIFNNQDDHDIEEKVIKKLNKYKITALPLSKCYLTTKNRYGLIFGYSAVNETLLNKKLKILRTIL